MKTLRQRLSKDPEHAQLLRNTTTGLPTVVLWFLVCLFFFLSHGFGIHMQRNT